MHTELQFENTKWWEGMEQIHMDQNWVWCWPLVSRVMKCLVPNEVENFSTSCATFSIKRTLLNGIEWQYRQERRNNSPHTNSSAHLPFMFSQPSEAKWKNQLYTKAFWNVPLTMCFGRYFLMLLKTAVLSKGQAVQRYYSFLECWQELFTWQRVTSQKTLTSSNTPVTASKFVGQ